MERKHYLLFGIMVLVHFIAMYYFMYAMVDTGAHVINNINNLYMAALMTTPMLILEIILMREMYRMKAWNIAIVAFGIILLIGSFSAIRAQAAVGDEQFLRSMIPHHSGAILMCERSSIEDQEISDLCDEIVKTQEEEIAQMERILQRIS